MSKKQSSTVLDISKDAQLKDLLVAFKIGEINVHQARFKISKLFANEMLTNQDIATEDWNEV